MRFSLCAALAASVVTACSFRPASAVPLEPLAKLDAVPFNQVEIRDHFWSPRQATNRLSSIPVNLQMLEKAGNIKNFELAAAKKTEGYSGPVFMDSDLYKGLEAASYSLATYPDKALEARLDEIIAKIAAAQMPNGYLNTHFQVTARDKMWSNLRDWHELYCAGHLFEAAVAHYQATGKRNFLDVATKLADHIDSVFGSAPGKRMGYPGHPEIELALVKLARVTGTPRYFELARFFIESRGQRFFAKEHNTPLKEYDGAYWQDDVPICDHRSIKGHAVRAAYLLSGATDIVRETDNPGLLAMIHRVWRNTTQRNMYVTGGIGPSAHNEGFTEDYDLPNLTAYQETCASVALAQWNHRLALLHGEARYADVFERSLYNGVLAGVALDGRRFFYVNPLESSGNHHRSEWFGCACCPPNVARTVASIGGYAYATSPDALWVNLYLQGAVKTTLQGKKVRVDVTTDYPWDGKVVLKPTLENPASLELRLRVPEWCQGATVAVNRKAQASPKLESGYLVLSREWRTGDTVELDLPMSVRRVAANPAVKADTGRLALQRGPLVYCVEACDQTADLASLYLPAETELKAERRPGVLGNVVWVTGMARVAAEQDWDRKLYQHAAAPKVEPLAAIPYCLWDNRKAGPMAVWLPVAPPTPRVGGPETKAKLTLSFLSSNSQPEGIRDGAEPKSSGDQPPMVCHWWPHKGTEEWVQYTWTKPLTLRGSKAYWFDDTGRGECRLPASWKVQYLDGNTWKPVANEKAYSVTKDAWDEVTFKPVTTTAVRLVVQLPPGWATGVHEWKVLVADEDE